MEKELETLEFGTSELAMLISNVLNTTTKEGYIAIQISSQITKKKVSENP